jgi:hypothetical protein
MADCFQFLAGKKTDSLTRVDPVGVNNLLVSLPEIRPHPGGIIEMLGDVPEGITVLDSIIES